MKKERGLIFVKSHNTLTYKQLILFFIPLGISSSFTSITHVIINGTLSRGENAAFIIACYAVAMSVFGIFERPVIIFRQTASALVHDKRGFRLLIQFMIRALIIITGINLIISYTPIGSWLYIHVFNANTDMVQAISETYKILSIVMIFSGIRGVYQGLIINDHSTKWLTIGVVSRLIGMLVLSSVFVKIGFITSMSGAFLFLFGLLIECFISFYKGHSLLKHDIPEEHSFKLLNQDISRFYFPLVAYFFMQTVLTPIIYILLAKSSDIEMSIASFSLAFSITNMILGFFMYTHQLVLQYYGGKDNQKIIYFIVVLSLIPTVLLSLLCYTPMGMLFMKHVMGADQALSIETIAVLKFFIIKTLLFPWVDFLNGFLMLKRQTNKMLFAQGGNLVIVTISLWIFVRLWPHLDGINGSIAAALGELAGFIIVGIIIYRMRDQINRLNQRKSATIRS